MSVFLNHYLVRLKAVAVEPFTLSVMIFSALAGLLYWPGPLDAASLNAPILSMEAEAGDPGINEAAIMLLWIFVWPMMVGNLAGGTVAGGGREAMALKPLPTLPVGLRTRVFAEALVILSFIFVVRIPSFIFGESVHGVFYLPGLLNPGAASSAAFIERSVLGAFLMLPFILAWASPSRSVQFYFMGRPLILLVLVLAAIKSGCIASPSGCIITGIALSVLVLASTGREVRLPRIFEAPAGSPASRFRPPLDPEVRLRRDQWQKPLPGAAAVLAILAALVAVDRIVVLPGITFYFCAVLVLSFALSMVALRPIGSFLITAALRGDTTRPGAFILAWSILPVRREAVTRGVYLHGLISAAVVYILGMGLVLLNTWLDTGVPGFRDHHGDSIAVYLLPFAAMIPCVAGGLTCTAVGDRVRGAVALVAGIGVLIGHHALLIANAPTWAHVAGLLLLAAAGGVPALVHLRAPRRTEHNRAPSTWNKETEPL